MEERSVPRVGSRFEGREKEKFALVAFSRQNEDGRNSEDVKLSQYSSAQISSGRRRMLYTRKMGYFDNRYCADCAHRQSIWRSNFLIGRSDTLQ